MAVVRCATEQDALLLACIHREARIAVMPWLPVIHSKDEVLAWMTNAVLARQEVFVVEVCDVVVGFIALTDGWVEHLYVKP